MADYAIFEEIFWPPKGGGSVSFSAALFICVVNG